MIIVVVFWLNAAFNNFSVVPQFSVIKTKVRYYITLFLVRLLLTFYSIITPFDAFEMENEAFALYIIFLKVLKTFLNLFLIFFSMLSE